MAEAIPRKRPIHIVRVSYGLTVNIGNFENVRFDLTAEVADDEDWRDVLDSLKQKSLRLKDQIQDEAR